MAHLKKQIHRLPILFQIESIVLYEKQDNNNVGFGLVCL